MPSTRGQGVWDGAGVGASVLVGAAAGSVAAGVGSQPPLLALPPPPTAGPGVPSPDAGSGLVCAAAPSEPAVGVVDGAGAPVGGAVASGGGTGVGLAQAPLWELPEWCVDAGPGAASFAAGDDECRRIAAVP